MRYSKVISPFLFSITFQDFWETVLEFEFCPVVSIFVSVFAKCMTSLRMISPGSNLYFKTYSSPPFEDGVAVSSLRSTLRRAGVGCSAAFEDAGSIFSEGRFAGVGDCAMATALPNTKAMTTAKALRLIAGIQNSPRKHEQRLDDQALQANSKFAGTASSRFCRPFTRAGKLGWTTPTLVRYPQDRAKLPLDRCRAPRHDS